MLAFPPNGWRYTAEQIHRRLGAPGRVFDRTKGPAGRQHRQAVGQTPCQVGDHAGIGGTGHGMRNALQLGKTARPGRSQLGMAGRIRQVASRHHREMPGQVAGDRQIGFTGRAQVGATGQAVGQLAVAFSRECGKHPGLVAEVVGRCGMADSGTPGHLAQAGRLHPLGGDQPGSRGKQGTTEIAMMVIASRDGHAGDRGTALTLSR